MDITRGFFHGRFPVKFAKLSKIFLEGVRLRHSVLLVYNERTFPNQKHRGKSNGMKSRGRFTKISEENAINEALGWQKDNTYQSPVQKNFETGVGRQSSKQCA